MNIKELDEKYNDYIIEQRRWLHAHPEISLQEVNTAVYLLTFLIIVFLLLN